MGSNVDRRAAAVLIVPPLLLLVSLLVVRDGAGPFWQWNLLDPAYFYLLDGLNLLNGRPPGHIAHPGIPVGLLDAASAYLSTAGGSVDDITRAAPGDPESVLRISSNLIIGLIVVAHFGLGLAAYRAFASPVAALAIQLAPFMSSIVLKHSFVPRPEAVVTLVTLPLPYPPFARRRWRAR